MVVCRLQLTPSLQRGLPYEFLSMQQQVYACFVEYCQREQIHLRLSILQHHPDTLHGYEQVMPLNILAKHPDKYPVKHTDCWHIPPLAKR
jgi:hypothetical protein